MRDVLVTAGEILVEIMAATVGTGFRAIQSLTGPYPSGAPAIFIDQAARLGARCAIIGAVGDDDFGWLNLDRLSRDGVDISAVATHQGIATGSAFVRYRADGTRDFVFNILHSASSRIALTPEAERVIARARRFHVMGSSLTIAAVRPIVERAIGIVKARGGAISFDPNLRKELMTDAGLHQTLQRVLAATDLFLPSGDEILMFAGTTDMDEAAKQLIGQGIKEIALKRGAAGAHAYARGASIRAGGFKVAEVDPTGAGDSFGATYTVCRDQGMGIERALSYANAAGARAVTIRGPMEGSSSFAELDGFIDQHGGSQ